MAKGQAVKKSTAECLAKIQEALDRIDVATTDIFRVINGSDDDWTDGGWTRQNVNDALVTLLNGQEQMQEAINKFSPTDKSTKKSKMKKTPIVNLYGNDDTDTTIEIDNYNEYADVTAQEIEALAPSAEVIVDMGQVDVVWRLPSGNHPGLWITSHGKGRQGVHVSAKHFDYPDEENVSGFLDYIQDKYGRKSYELVNSGSGLPPEEIKEAISEMEQELGRYAVQTTMPIYNASAKKSKQPSIDISFEASVNSLRKTNYAKCGNINTIVKERK